MSIEAESSAQSVTKGLRCLWWLPLWMKTRRRKIRYPGPKKIRSSWVSAPRPVRIPDKISKKRFRQAFVEVK